MEVPSQAAITPSVLYLHMEVLKIVHYFWCQFLDFKYKVSRLFNVKHLGKLITYTTGIISLMEQ